MNGVGYRVGYCTRMLWLESKLYINGRVQYNIHSPLINYFLDRVGNRTFIDEPQFNSK